MIKLMDKRILVTGGHGFLGSYVVKRLMEIYCNPFSFTSGCYDLTNISMVKHLISDIRPQIVIHLAASVGGIGANQKRPADFFYDNAIMGMNLMEEARRWGVEKLVTIGTVCSYPKHCEVPFKEEDLWKGYPEETNAPYGLAKKMLLVQGQAYRKQYGFNSIFLIPTNLYGPGDNFNPDTSHVIPAIIRKIQDAIDNNLRSVELWGDGTPTREFLYVKDAAEAIVKATIHYDGIDPVNIGTGRDITIRDLFYQIADLMDYDGNVEWDSTKPNGQPKRKLDISKAKELFGFTAKTSLEDGLSNTIQYYRNNKDNL